MKVSELVSFCEYMNRSLDEVAVGEQNGELMVYVEAVKVDGLEIAPLSYNEDEVIYLAWCLGEMKLRGSR